MPGLTKYEQEIIKHYNPNQGPEKNAKRISRETGIKLPTCRCYITSLRKGIGFGEYLTQHKKDRFIPTDPEKVAELYERQRGIPEKTLNNMEVAEMIAAVQEMLESLPSVERKLILSHFYEGKSYRKISKETGMPAQSICWKMGNILKKLRFQATRKGLQNYVAA